MDEEKIASFFCKQVDRHRIFYFSHSIDIGNEITQAIHDFLEGVDPNLTVGELLKVIEP